MIDLAEALDASAPGPSWTVDAAYRVATVLAEGTPFTLDWDRDAGEAWISLLAETSRVAMVSTTRPIAVLAEDGPRLAAAAEAAEFRAVIVPSFDAPVLACDRDRLEAVFGPAAKMWTEIGPRFSAEDLWFATV